MKATESTTITIDMLMWHAELIQAQCNERDIGRIFSAATQEAKERDKQQTADPAKIPVSVLLTLRQAKMILDELRPLIGAPADRECYEVVKKAVDSVD